MGYIRNEGRIKKAKYLYRTYLQGSGMSYTTKVWIMDATTGGHQPVMGITAGYPYTPQHKLRNLRLATIPPATASVWEIEEYEKAYQITHLKTLSERGSLRYGNKKQLRKWYNRRMRRVGTRAEHFAQMGELDSMDRLNFDKDKTYWRDVF